MLKFWKPGLPVLLVITACALINFGTIRRNEDPIRDTQTNPIGYDAKKEEMKDGEKGAPMPTWRLYPRFRFLSEAPMKSYVTADELLQEHAIVEQEQISDDVLGNFVSDEAPPRVPENEPVPHEELVDQWWSEIVVENQDQEIVKKDESQQKTELSKVDSESDTNS